MVKEIIQTPNAPAPIGPYNQAVKSGNFLFISGQIALDPVTGNLLIDNIEDETTQVMKNIGNILAEAGAGFDKVVKTTIFLSDMELFAPVNEVYGTFFSKESAGEPAFPARETVAVKGLPRNVHVEISMIAML